jgi:hypothetical protein
MRVQLSSGVCRARPQDLILTVNPTVDIPSLDERDDLLFCIFDRPPECCAHALKPNRRKRLEIENDCAGADERNEAPDV